MKEIEAEESCASQFHKRKKVGIMLNDMEIYYTATGEHPDEETIENIIQIGDSENFLKKDIQE